MAKLDQFKKLVTDFAKDVDFITIYIDEAHPTDGWAFDTNPFKIATHTSIESRIMAAGILAEYKLPCPLLVDTMANEANLAFEAMPEKLVIIDTDGQIAYIGEPGPFGYKPEHVREWIENFNNKKSK